jgi:GMP synthase (glutamine-hydrolysing)
MTMKTAFCIRHVAFEDLGTLAPVLAAKGYQATYVEAAVEDLTQIDPLSPDLLIVLGGPIGVYNVKDYPFLQDEITLVEKRLAADLPTLGICLGSQIIAHALGANVYFSGRKEIGWKPLILSQAGRQSCLAALAPELISVLHWHGDTFDLPQGATHLAATDEFQNQAFTWGRNCLALQFHIEVTQQQLQNWFVGHALEISTTSGVSVAQLRSDTQRWGAALEQQGAIALTQWLEQIQVNSVDQISLTVAG